MSKYARFNLSITLFLIFSILLIIKCSANPIPVYPDPEPVYSSSSGLRSLNITWIILVFVMDFFIDILIIYGGIYLLHYYGLIAIKNVFEFNKSTLFTAVFFISLVGLFSEIIFGYWIGGLIIALFFIFLSFVFASKKLLGLDWTNCIRMGLIGLIINIVVWIVIFSI